MKNFEFKIKIKIVWPVIYSTPGHYYPPDCNFSLVSLLSFYPPNLILNYGLTTDLTRSLSVLSGYTIPNELCVWGCLVYNGFLDPLFSKWILDMLNPEFKFNAFHVVLLNVFRVEARRGWCWLMLRLRVYDELQWRWRFGRGMVNLLCGNFW